MVWFALQVYYFMAFTYSLPLQFQDFFSKHLPISIWACINMYKSLLRKNRIPSTALKSLKGALSCLNFFSCSHETVSISAGGVLSRLAPTKAQASSTLCPMIPWYSSPRWNEWGEGIPGSGLGRGFRGRAWQSPDAAEGAASLSNKWVNSSVKAQRGLQVMKTVIEEARLPHSWVSHRWHDEWWLHVCCRRAIRWIARVVLQWRGSLSCEWWARPFAAQKRKAVNWPGNEKERERGSPTRAAHVQQN